MSVFDPTLFPFGVTSQWSVIPPSAAASTDNMSPPSDTSAAADPNTATGQAATAAAAAPATTSASSGGASSFVKWTLAMVALWFILTALYEYGGGAQKIAPYLAGLVLFGVIYAKGPQALSNLQGGI